MTVEMEDRLLKGEGSGNEEESRIGSQGDRLDNNINLVLELSGEWEDWLYQEIRNTRIGEQSGSGLTLKRTASYILVKRGKCCVSLTIRCISHMDFICSWTFGYFVGSFSSALLHPPSSTPFKSLTLNERKRRIEERGQHYHQTTSCSLA